MNIPLDATEKEKLIDPRIEDYPSTSPSWVDPSELSELDQMLQAQLVTRTTTTTTITTDGLTEETPAIQWTTLDSIWTIDNFIGAT